MQLGWAPGILQEEGCSHITGSRLQPRDHLGGVWHCPWLLTFPAILFSRWDIQRIREQRILQRLQLRMYKRKGIQESEPEVTSFFPEPDDGEAWEGGVGGSGADRGSHTLGFLSAVESLLITPYLPVVAFGRPLPKLTPQ